MRNLAAAAWLCGLLLHDTHAWAHTRLPSTYWRTSAMAVPRLGGVHSCIGEPAEVPTTLGDICTEAIDSVRSALMGGKRGMRVDVGVPALDMRSRMFDADVLARLCLEIGSALTLLKGPILLLTPGMSTGAAIISLLESDDLEWSDDLRSALQVSTLSVSRPPPLPADPREPPPSDLPAAVIVVSLSPSSDSDDPSYLNGRAWLGLAPICAVVCINAEFRVPPRELSDFDATFAFVSYGVTKTAANERGEGVGDPETAGRALLRRNAPGLWRLLLDVVGDGSYILVSQTEQKPSEEMIRDILSREINGARSVAAPGGAQVTDPRSNLEALFAASPDASPDASLDASPTFRSIADDPTTAPAPGVIDSTIEGTNALGWDQIQATKSDWRPMKVYQAATLLRVRCLGGGARFKHDAQALHILAGVIPSERGAPASVDASCLLFYEDGGARLEQLAVRPEVEGGRERRARLASDLLRRAESEALRLGAKRLVISPLPIDEVRKIAEGDEAGEDVDGAVLGEWGSWLEAAGFVPRSLLEEGMADRGEDRQQSVQEGVLLFKTL